MKLLRTPLLLLIFTIGLALVLLVSAIFNYIRAVSSADLMLRSRIDDFVNVFKLSARSATYDRGVMNRLAAESITDTFVMIHILDKNGRIVAGSSLSDESFDSPKENVPVPLDTDSALYRYHTEEPFGEIVDVILPFAPPRPYPPKVEIEPLADLYGPFFMRLKVRTTVLAEQKRDAAVHFAITAAAVLVLVLLTLRQYQLYHREIQLQKKLREEEQFGALGRMSAVLAHEIRNPLGSIKGYSQLMKEDMSDSSPHAKRLDIVIKETSHLERLVNSLLTYSKPLSLRKVKISLKEVIQRAIDLVQKEAERAEVTFEIHERQPDVEGEVDPEQIKQVLTNLFLNAVTAIGKGGRVLITLSRKADRIEVEVRDTGPGIPRENRGKIFEPFFTTRSKGTGLGLAICRKIIAEHGGEMALLPSETAGAAFLITLPTQERADEQ